MVFPVSHNSSSNNPLPFDSNRCVLQEGMYYVHSVDDGKAISSQVFIDWQTRELTYLDEDDRYVHIPEEDYSSRIYKENEERELVHMPSNPPPRPFLAASNRAFSYTNGADPFGMKGQNPSQLSPFPNASSSAASSSSSSSSSSSANPPESSSAPNPSSSSAASSSSASSPSKKSLEPSAPVPIIRALTSKETDRLSSDYFSPEEKKNIARANYFVKHPTRMLTEWEEVQNLLNTLLQIQYNQKKAFDSAIGLDFRTKKESEKNLMALDLLVSLFRKTAEDHAKQSQKPLIIFNQKLDREIVAPKFSEKSLPVEIENAQQEQKLIKDIRNELHSMWTHRKEYDEICDTLQNDKDLEGSKYIATSSAHRRKRDETYRKLDRLMTSDKRSSLDINSLEFSECQEHLNKAIRLYRQLKLITPTSPEIKRERDQLLTRLLEFHRAVAEYAISCATEDSTLTIIDINADPIPSKDMTEQQRLREDGFDLLKVLRKEDKEIKAPESLKKIKNAPYEKETIKLRGEKELEKIAATLNFRPKKNATKRDIEIVDESGITKRVEFFIPDEESPITPEGLKYWSFLDFSRPLEECVKAFNQAVHIYRGLVKAKAIEDSDRAQFFATLEIFREEIKCRAIAENAQVSFDSFYIDSEPLVNPTVQLPDNSLDDFRKRFYHLGYKLEDSWASALKDLKESTSNTVQTGRKAVGYVAVATIYEILDEIRDVWLENAKAAFEASSNTDTINAPVIGTTIPANSSLYIQEGAPAIANMTHWTQDALSCLANQVARIGGWAPEMVLAILILYMASPNGTTLRTTLAKTAAIGALTTGLYYGSPYLQAEASSLITTAGSIALAMGSMAFEVSKFMGSTSLTLTKATVETALSAFNMSSPIILTGILANHYLGKKTTPNSSQVSIPSPVFADKGKEEEDALGSLGHHVDEEQRNQPSSETFSTSSWRNWAAGMTSKIPSFNWKSISLGSALGFNLPFFDSRPTTMEQNLTDSEKKLDALQNLKDAPAASSKSSSSNVASSSDPNGSLSSSQNLNQGQVLSSNSIQASASDSENIEESKPLEKKKKNPSQKQRRAEQKKRNAALAKAKKETLQDEIP